MTDQPSKNWDIAMSLASVSLFCCPYREFLIKKYHLQVEKKHLGLYWPCRKKTCVHSSFTIILKRMRKLVLMLYNVIINVLLLFLTVPWVCLLCMIVEFSDQTHFLGVSTRSYPK